VTFKVEFNFSETNQDIFGEISGRFLLTNNRLIATISATPKDGKATVSKSRTLFSDIDSREFLTSIYTYKGSVIFEAVDASNSKRATFTITPASLLSVFENVNIESIKKISFGATRLASTDSSAYKAQFDNLEIYSSNEKAFEMVTQNMFATRSYWESEGSGYSLLNETVTIDLQNSLFKLYHELLTPISDFIAIGKPTTASDSADDIIEIIATTSDISLKSSQTTLDSKPNFVKIGFIYQGGAIFTELKAVFDDREVEIYKKALIKNIAINTEIVLKASLIDGAVEFSATSEGRSTKEKYVSDIVAINSVDKRVEVDGVSKENKIAAQISAIHLQFRADTVLRFNTPQDSKMVQDELNRDVFWNAPIVLNDEQNSKSKLILKNNGKIESSIHLQDLDGNTLKKSSITSPDGSNTLMKSDGTITTINEGASSKVEVFAYPGGDVKTELSEYSGSKLTTMLPLGAAIEIKDDNSFLAKLQDDANNIELLSLPNAKKRVTIKAASGKNYTNTLPDIAQNLTITLLDSQSTKALTDTSYEAVSAEFTSDRNFIVDERRESDGAEVTTTMEISPTIESTFAEVMSEDGTSTITLLEGEAEIVVDGSATSMEINSSYTIPTTTISEAEAKEPFVNGTLTLKEGWNLIANPIDGEGLLAELSGMGAIYIYKNGEWELNPTSVEQNQGIWVYTESAKSIDLLGEEYANNIADFTTGWNLLGAGENIMNASDVYALDAAYKYENDEWVTNPEMIYQGEGFWIRRGE